MLLMIIIAPLPWLKFQMEDLLVTMTSMSTCVAGIGGMAVPHSGQAREQTPVIASINFSQEVPPPAQHRNEVFFHLDFSS